MFDLAKEVKIGILECIQEYLCESTYYITDDYKITKAIINDDDGFLVVEDLVGNAFFFRVALEEYKLIPGVTE